MSKNREIQENWDEIWITRKGVSDGEIKFWKFMQENFMSLAKNAKILEIGCGSGRTLKILSKRYNMLIGIDFSQESLRLSKKEIKDVTFLKADAFFLPFKSNSFDLVFSNGLLEHFQRPEDLEILNETVRITKWHVVASVPSLFCPWYQIYKMLYSLFFGWPWGYERDYSVFDLKKRFENLGLKTVKLYGFQLFPPHHTGFRKAYPYRLMLLLNRIENILPNKLKTILCQFLVIVAKK